MSTIVPQKNKTRVRQVTKNEKLTYIPVVEMSAFSTLGGQGARWKERESVEMELDGREGRGLERGSRSKVVEYVGRQGGR